MKYKEKLINILKSKNIRNSFWIIGEQVFQMIVSLIIGIMSARYLGPSNYGTLNYTASFVTFFTSIATLSAEGTVIKKMIEFPEREGEYLGSSMFLRIVSSFFSIISISIIVFILNTDELIKVILVLLQSTQLMFKSIQILDAWFQRHLKSKYVSIGKMAACILVACYKLFLLASSKSIVWFAFSNSLSDLVISIVLYIFYRQNNGMKLSINIRTGIEILSESYHFILSGIMSAIYSQMDRIMIGEMLSDFAIGLYTTATAICSMWIFVPIAIINSFCPTIMELKQAGDEEKYLCRLEQLYSVVIWICVFISIGIVLLAEPIVLILYGKEYIGAIAPLKFVIWSETFSIIGTARGIWVLCEKKNKYVKYYLAIGTITNMVLNTILIPSYGIKGAAVATLITQLVTSIIAPLLFKQTRIHTKIVIEAIVCKWLWNKNGDKR